MMPCFYNREEAQKWYKDEKFHKIKKETPKTGLTIFYTAIFLFRIICAGKINFFFFVTLEILGSLLTSFVVVVRPRTKKCERERTKLIEKPLVWVVSSIRHSRTNATSKPNPKSTTSKDHDKSRSATTIASYHIGLRLRLQTETSESRQNPTIETAIFFSPKI